MDTDDDLSQSAQDELARLRKRVAELERAEALRQAEERFAKVFHFSPVAIVIVALSDGRVIDVMEVKQRTKSGELRDISASVELIDLGGEPCILALLHDNTERKRAEQVLQETQRNLRLIAENTSDSVFAYDVNRQLLYQNAAFEHLTEYSLDELRTYNVINYLHPDDKARMRAFFETAFQGHSFADVEYRIISKIEACKLELEPVAFDLRRSLDETLELFAVQARRKGLALAQVQQLEGLIPICAYCKKVRDDQDYWQQVEIYIMRHSRPVQPWYLSGVLPAGAARAEVR